MMIARDPFLQGYGRPGFERPGLRQQPQTFHHPFARSALAARAGYVASEHQPVGNRDETG